MVERSSADIVEALEEARRFLLNNKGLEADRAIGYALASLQPATLTAGDALSDLVARFAAALLNKLQSAQAKGRSGWDADDWKADCQRGLADHVAKGDPLDVAAYAAFCWHHGWPTIGPITPREYELVSKLATDSKPFSAKANLQDVLAGVRADIDRATGGDDRAMEDMKLAHNVRMATIAECKRKAARGGGVWITVEVDRALYVDRGNINIACDRDIVGPEGGTLLLKMKSAAGGDAVVGCGTPGCTDPNREAGK